MTDVFNKAKRSDVMSRIHGRATKPEVAVRSRLHDLGIRFRTNVRSLPGSPDIVLPKCRVVIFIHGCFWHRHKGCKRASIPKTRRRFWQDKFAANVARDRRNTLALRRLGWTVITIWGCRLALQLRSLPTRLARAESRCSRRPQASYHANSPGRRASNRSVFQLTTKRPACTSS